jgi:hypothetical protein
VAVRGKNEVRVRLQEGAEPCGVIAEAEVIVLLLALFDEAPLRSPGAVSLAVLVAEELLLAD